MDTPQTWMILLVLWIFRSPLWCTCNKAMAFNDYLEQNKASKKADRNTDIFLLNRMAPKPEITLWCKRPSCATVRWKCNLTFVPLPCHSVVGLFCSSVGALSCWVSSHSPDHRDQDQDGLYALWFCHLLACRPPEPQALIWPLSNQVSVMTEPPVHLGTMDIVSWYVQMEFSSFCLGNYYSRRT